MVSVLPIIGGFILIIGAFFTYKGDIFKAVLTYLVADIMWIGMALSASNFLGALLILIGASLGLMAFLKMNAGLMRKNLNN